MAENELLQIVFDGSVQGLQQASKEAESALGGVQDKGSQLGEYLTTGFHNAAIIGAAGIAALGVAAYTSITAFEESEKVQSALTAVLHSTKSAAGESIEALDKQSHALQENSTFDDEAIGHAQALLLTFTGIKKAAFDQAIPAIANLSTSLGQDLQSSAIQVGKALNEPIQGINALRRVGVSFTEEQKAVVKQLVDTGQTAKAQQLIINELNTEFGGQASAASKNFAGSLAVMKNEINDLEESLGGFLVKALGPYMEMVKYAIAQIRDLINGNQSLDDVLNGLKDEYGAVGQAVANVINFFRQHHDALVALIFVISGPFIAAILAAIAVVVSFIAPVLLLTAIVTSVSFAVYELIQHTGGLTNAMKVASDVIKSISIIFMTLFKPVIDDIVKVFVTELLPTLAVFWKEYGPQIIAFIKNAAAALGILLVGGIMAALGAIDLLVRGITLILDLFNVLAEAPKNIAKSFKDLWTTVQDIWNKIVGLVKNPGSALGAIGGILHDLKIPGFAEGGIVPGAIGAPMLAIVHGGEKVIPNNSNSSSNSSVVINFGDVSVRDQTDIDGIITAVKRALGRDSDLSRYGAL